VKRALGAILILLAAATAALPAAETSTTDELRRKVADAEETRLKRTLDLARMSESAGRTEEASKLYREALSLRPDDAEIMEALLQTLRALGDWKSQLPLYQRLASTHPGEFKLHLALGECLWRLGRLDEARKVWDGLLKRFPRERSIYAELTEFYLAEGKLDEAKELLKRRRERFGEEGEAVLAEARVAMAAGETDAGVAALLRCLDMELSDESALRAERLLITVALRAGKTGEVEKRLRETLASTSEALGERLRTLAGEAAERKEFAEAVALAEQALSLIADAKKKEELKKQMESWKKN
jgi:tetratricopeptide (TPR) repeat protein